MVTPKILDDSAECNQKAILEGRLLLPVEHLTNVPSKYISTFLIIGNVFTGYWTFRFRIVLWINRIKV